MSKRVYQNYRARFNPIRSTKRNFGCSESVADEEFKPGSIFQVFIKKGNEKRGKWSGDKVVLEFDRASRMVVVPGSNGKKIHSAVEDVRAALHDD